jgi:hypothetical protein
MESLARLAPNNTSSSVLACLVASLLALPPSVLGPSVSRAQEMQPDEIHELWSAVIDPMLRGKLQSSDQAQTEGQELLVPLHATFVFRDPAWELDFSALFSRLVSDPSVLPDVVLSRLEYLYLASEFLVLAKQSGRQELIPPGLGDLLFSEVRNAWQVAPAWQWGRKPFPGGIRERILWKLNTRKVDKNYYRAIVDDDLFLLAIAADLKAFAGPLEQTEAWNATLDDILRTACKVFSQEGVFQSGGGWLFQPGVWADHPEYQYAGNEAAEPGIRPAPVPGIAADTSHSMRFAAWLTSLMGAYPPGSDGYRFYASLREGLEKQFFEKVLIAPTAARPCYLLNNFMDGSNGVYRWNYQSLGNGSGYGPNQLSGSLLLGWWSVLDTQPIRDLYANLASQFPWAGECLDFYLGPTSSSPRPAGRHDPTSPAMRLWHVCVLLASRL